MTLKTLIVDDEPVARRVLREELESVPDVEVVGEADNGAAAAQPDLPAAIPISFSWICRCPR